MKAYDHLPGVEPLSEEVIQASLASLGEGELILRGYLKFIFQVAFCVSVGFGKMADA